MSNRRYVLLIGGVLAVAVAPLGYRTGLLPVLPALGLLAVGLLVSLWMLAVGVLWTLRRRSSVQRQNLTAVVLALAAGVVVVPQATIYQAIGAPVIHDITTDTEDPPQFDAIVEVRADAPNPLDYGGPEVAAAQHAAYPDIQPMVVAHAPHEVVELVRAAVQKLGWEIVAVNAEAGLIEATDTTYWFGFKDDVAVRLRPVGAGATRVDVRSISRVGGGDLGANAARIRRLLERLRAVTG